MSSAQLRLAETIDTFYSASDKTSESALAAHGYRRSVEELDAGIGRELVRYSLSRHIRLRLLITMSSLDVLSLLIGCPISHDHPRSTRQDELVFPNNKRAYLKTEQEGESRTVPVIRTPLDRTHLWHRRPAPRLRCRTQ